MFPHHVIDFIGAPGCSAVPEAVSKLAHKHEGITIFFMDIVGFTTLAKEADPHDVMKMLNELFSAFGSFCSAHDVYKVISGWSYLCLNGVRYERASESEFTLSQCSSFLTVLVPSLPQVETVGDCYVAASGLMANDTDGFVRIAGGHDPVKSAGCMIEFAKSVLAHAKTVKMPNSGESVTVRPLHAAETKV